MFEKMNLECSYYLVFDRMGEDVYYQYSVEYDWNSILQNNFNKENFKIIPGNSPHNSFFEEYFIDKLQWEKKMANYLLGSRNEVTHEAFLDNLSKEQIEAYESKW